LKGYTKGERVLRFEAIAHNTKDLRCGKALEKFALIVTRLKQMAEEFCTALDCVDAGFIPDGLLDALPAASQLGSTRVGGIDVNKPRTRAVLAAALALAIAPGGFTVADFTAKVRDMTGQAGYTSRNAAYDLRKLRGKHAGQPRQHPQPATVRARRRGTRCPRRSAPVMTGNSFVARPSAFTRPGRPPERICDELRLGVGIGLAVACVLRRQPPLQVLITPGQPVIAPQRVAERDLLRPPRVTGSDHVQVRCPPPAGGVRLDEEPPPQPSPVQIRRHVTPAVRGEPFPRLHDHDVRIGHRCHQVDDRFGSKSGDRRRADMLNPACQPRRQQPGQLVALGKRPVSEPRIMRQNLRLLIRPCRDSIAHEPTLDRHSAARPPDQPASSASRAGAPQGR